MVDSTMDAYLFSVELNVVETMRDPNLLLVESTAVESMRGSNLCSVVSTAAETAIDSVALPIQYCAKSCRCNIQDSTPQVEAVKSFRSCVLVLAHALSEYYNLNSQAVLIQKHAQMLSSQKFFRH